MIITRKRLIEAEAAVRPLLQVAGLSVGVQMKIAKLYRDLATLRDDYIEAETKIAEAMGANFQDGSAVFKTKQDRIEFEEKRKKIMESETEVESICIGADDPLWGATTPGMLVALEGVLIVEGES